MLGARYDILWVLFRLPSTAYRRTEPIAEKGHPGCYDKWYVLNMHELVHKIHMNEAVLLHVYRT